VIVWVIFTYCCCFFSEETNPCLNHLSS
jgi:hypothetical protein